METCGANNDGYGRLYRWSGICIICKPIIRDRITLVFRVVVVI